jgi:hypothetical protein
MKLDGRISRLEMADDAWSVDPYQGATVADLTLWEYWRPPGASGVPRYLREDPPEGVERLAMTIASAMVRGILAAPARRRAELERTRVADQWRARHGYAVVLDAAGLAHYESQIAEAEAEAAAIKNRFGLADSDDADLVLAEIAALG